MGNTVTKLDDYRLPVRYDGKLAIATGRNRFEKSWKNKNMLWSSLLWKLSKSQQTSETHAEYMKMPKDQQDKIKDVGGFVGGHLREGKRKNGYVEGRQILTMDLDFAPKNFWDQLMDNLDVSGAVAIYSTHKHTETRPRLRLVMPLDREVSADEYEAIARKVADKIGIDYFDDTTYQPTRLMYWPSHSVDSGPVFEYRDEPFISADEILAEYPDWTDISYWPMSSRVPAIIKKQIERQKDPLLKKGSVGAFCNTYTIPEAIETFLPEIYTPTDKPDRYTYAFGSTTCGLVLYEDGIFAYSNHGTDPAGGQLCNAFDLVRIHKYGYKDEDVEGGISGKDLPSYKAMAVFASNDSTVRIKSAREDFGEDVPEVIATRLDRTSEMAVKPTIGNAVLILKNDPELQGIRFNELSRGVEVTGKLEWNRPDKYWRDADDAQLYAYVFEKYHVQFPENRFQKAFTVAVDGRRFNPLQDYITDLPRWDEEERVDTLLVDYLGADDTAYTRAVTRKTLAGAVQRALHPGCKFDTVLVLDGKPGIGKSTLLRKLGGQWFSDSLSLTDVRDKTAAEKLQGVWIMEVGEMQGTRKADVDMLKGFLSRQVDEYRPAYGRVVERRPRTAVICGTTNSTTGFLRDTTGNRRFWPVPVTGDGLMSVWDMDDATVAQIWSEAAVYAARGEDLYLDPELEKEAVKMQQAALEYDEREGAVLDYLDTLLPEDWYSWDLQRRVDYFHQDELSPRQKGTRRRRRVCSTEIFCECFGRPKNSMKRQDSYEIAAIMARIPGWERRGDATRIPGYGQQRPFVRV